MTDLDNWEGCYDDNWKNLISPEAFSHPAKFPRGLIQRIYQYCLEKQYFTEGMTILDPFGGVGLGAIATHYGLNWLGNELEPRFCQMAWSWDCPGLAQESYDGYKGQCESPQDWYKLNLGICSECVYKAIDGEQPQPGLFEQVGYFTDPHRYIGNLERFERYAQDGTWAKLTQGDSRKLNKIWAKGLLSSPPYASLHVGGDLIVDKNKWGKGKGLAKDDGKNYATSPGQLANMPEGLVSSSPYADSLETKGGIDPDKSSHIGGRHSQMNQSDTRYGSEDGNLGGMSEGLVSSPPFAGNTGGKGKASRDGIDPALFDRHSGGMVGGMHGTEGNLEGMQPGGLVSSPPFAKHGAQNQGNQQRGGGKRLGESGDSYTTSTEGQLSSLPEGLFSSPPFAASVGSDDSQKRGGILKSDPKRESDKNLTGDYGDSEGQLATMGEGLVSSSPFEDSITGSENINFGDRPDGTSFGAGKAMQSEYGSTPSNIGNDSGPTFFSAAADIVRQCHSLLAPDSIVVFITKNYIKNGREVDFTGNWIALCESCGFELIEQKRAMLVKNLGTQLSYSGDDHKIIIERKSFFRRLHEKKRPDLKIDWESILFFRRM